MEPGIYDIPNEEYHSSVGMSRSAIMEFMRSPLHYWDAYLNPNKPERTVSPQMVLGEAVHLLTLERDRFSERFAIEEKVDKRTKAGKELAAQFELNNAGKHIINIHQFDEALTISSAVLDDTVMSDLLNGTRIETSFYWVDEDSGILCKCRPDAWASGDGLDYVIDLKTTNDGRYREFSRSIYNYGYHLQAAMALDGIKAIHGTTPESFVFITVETRRPYATAVYPLDQHSIELGRLAYKRQLFLYKECLERNEWPSYNMGTMPTISLPAYVKEDTIA